MNDEQHAFWLAYIRQLADLLGLKDWRIDLDRDPVNREGPGASNYTYYGRKAADIALGPSFPNQSPEDQRWILAHECLHCHFDRLHKGVIDYAESKGDSDDSYFAKAHLRDFEAVVDTMAVIIAPFLPLPGQGGLFGAEWDAQLARLAEQDERTMAVVRKTWQPVTVGGEG